jgi:hypothetical protein
VASNGSEEILEFRYKDEAKDYCGDVEDVVSYFHLGGVELV